MAKPYGSVQQQVLAQNELSAKEQKEIRANILSCVAAINASLQQHHLKAKAMVGGSAAKGTFLKGDFDVDIFVMFDYPAYVHQQEKLSDLLEPALSFSKNLLRVHGSRDYFQINDGLHFEVIPVLQISTAREVKNVTDASPLHVGWILHHLKKNPQLKDEILLTKLFCKAQGLYGAESYIRGFSGHVIDLLVIHYGSFSAFMKAAASWKPKVVIDPKKRPPKNILAALNHSKTEGPLILVDPIQPERNAAASLSTEKFDLLTTKAKAYMQKPSVSFFERKPLTLAFAKQQCRNDVGCFITIKPLEGKEDVVGAKLLKIVQFLEHKLAQHNFTLLFSRWEWKPEDATAVVAFVLKKETLSPLVIHEGPPIKATQHAQEFQRKYMHTFQQNGRVYARLPRPYPEPLRLIKELLKDPYVTERCSVGSLSPL
ncbi:nucleotidyltransferase domain-containing protein [Candidatus Woesearchaeota archaeon]|nr:nucleotidyltransferase domain-containing protein [Candidatus Woesearchaeota archaeon]